MPRTPKLDPTILKAALTGLEQKRQRLDEQIGEIRRMLGAKGRAAGTATATGAPKKRHLSAAARKRIAAAQKKRWDAYRKAKGSQ